MFQLPINYSIVIDDACEARTINRILIFAKKIIYLLSCPFSENKEFSNRIFFI